MATRMMTCPVNENASGPSDVSPVTVTADVAVTAASTSDSDSPVAETAGSRNNAVNPVITNANIVTAARPGCHVKMSDSLRATVRPRPEDQDSWAPDEDSCRFTGSIIVVSGPDD